MKSSCKRIFSIIFSIVAGCLTTTQFAKGDDTSYKLQFINSCDSPIKIMSTSNPNINGNIVQNIPPNIPLKLTSAQLNNGGLNSFHLAPVPRARQCNKLSCNSWQDIQKKGQRMGYMWMNNTIPPYNHGRGQHNNNLSYAAYCQPTNAYAGQCITQGACCGPTMTFDATFGTLFEITPNGGNNLDYIDLSTNYGYGPRKPPTLCSSPGANPNDCVTETANIFFNIPIQVVTSNQCSFTSKKEMVTKLSCLKPDCSQAYQHPTDDKQTSCPNDTTYTVTFCPPGASLPPIP